MLLFLYTLVSYSLEHFSDVFLLFIPYVCWKFSLLSPFSVIQFDSYFLCFHFRGLYTPGGVSNLDGVVCNRECSLIYFCLPVSLSAFTFIFPYLVNAHIPTPVHVNKTISYFVHPGICASLLVHSFDLHVVT